MKSNTEIKKTYYTVYKGKKVGIYHGEWKLLRKMVDRDITALHECLPTELKATMYWYLHSNEIPKFFNVFPAKPTSSNGFNCFTIVERIDGPGLW